MRLMRRKKAEKRISEYSNIIQLDDMGYPLMLCIMSDGTQQWIDISEQYAKKEVSEGRIHILEWKKG